MRLASSREWSPEEIREAFPEPPEEWGRRGKGDIQHALFAGEPDEPHAYGGFKVDDWNFCSET